MKTLPKLVQALTRLMGMDQFKKPDSDEVDLTKITYRDTIEAFASAQVEESHVFSDVRDLVLAEIGFGIANILDKGGPTNPENTLHYEGITALLKLWRETVACQTDLDREQRRDRKRLREEAKHEHADTQGGKNVKSTNVVAD